MEAKKTKVDNSQLWKYSGMALQFFVSIGVAVFLGIKTDQWIIGTKTPIAAWALPLLVITGIIIKVFRDTARKK